MEKLNFTILFLLLFAACNDSNDAAYNKWQVYGGDKDNLHYSSLNLIDTININLLTPAWYFHTGDADTTSFSQIQCNPIVIDTVMYITSPSLILFAINAGTGEKIWEFNPDSNYINSKPLQFSLNNNRGVTYWTDGKNDKRIFYVASSFLHCINATDGNLVKTFGDNGLVDLHIGLEREVGDLYVTATSPGIIYKDQIILGTRVDEGPAAAPGHIRAFDVRSGEIKWVFHTIPKPGEYGYDTWEDPNAYKFIGGANSWSGFSLDQTRGIVFAPTGSASYDFYGGMRKGKNLFANCLLALDAATGKHIWHFQFVHHDIWDWDLPCPPVLATITKDERKIDVVVQVSKNGMVWVFERATGEPVYPIDEISIDTSSELIGEKVWPKQPVSLAIKPFVRQTLTVNDINPYLPDTSKRIILEKLKEYRFGKMFIPPGKKPSLHFPGFDGGAEWGGPSCDPETSLLYVNANEMGWVIKMNDVRQSVPLNENYSEAGKRLYNKYCVTCHGSDKKGTGNYPALDNITDKYTSDQVLSLLSSGRRMMPSFNFITEEEKNAIVTFILNNKEYGKKKFFRQPQEQDEYRNLPYVMDGYKKFLSPEGLPAISPPWGTLTAIDLNTGKHVWKTTLGEYPEYKAMGIPPTGTENYGGSVVTRGGLLFIAAARDGKFRAYNKFNGKLLWEFDLPSPGFATPSVYEVNGKQFIVIACGGGKLKTKSSDTYIAFSLPK